jgi:hypothetical protein
MAGVLDFEFEIARDLDGVSSVSVSIIDGAEGYCYLQG